MKPIHLSAIAACSVIVLTGCATVTKGTQDTVKFESQPAGARVNANAILDGGATMGPFSCTTPCEMELRRNKTWEVEFVLDGYKPAKGNLVPRGSGDGAAGFAGNVIAGGIIGMGIDAGSGALLDLKPNPVNAQLVPENVEGEESVILNLVEDKQPTESSEAAADEAASDETVDTEAEVAEEPASNDGQSSEEAAVEADEPQDEASDVSAEQETSPE